MDSTTRELLPSLSGAKGNGRRGRPQTKKKSITGGADLAEVTALEGRRSVDKPNDAT